ncbi:MAG TPA: hypothetical protein DEQ34_01210 [Balneolaceae bacterium]|nr:hypothetical protein [Balneolaceae bacterium]|tara:strand:- start:108292 stop:108579 length:288 start_codon:yes stop_codon:yes gene_type:complete
MPELHETRLEKFPFGEQPEDVFYLLIDLKANPEGVDLVTLSNTDPRFLDATLNEMGCLLMLSGDEMNELIRRGQVTESEMHATLFELAKKEGIIK